jgi:hypothetical protein
VQELKILRGAGLLTFMTSLIALAVGVALVYVLPEYIIGVLNTTGLFTAATVATATTQVNTLRAIGWLVVVISLIWMVVGVIGMVRGGK